MISPDFNYLLAAYGFLIPLNKRLTGMQFAQAIESYFDAGNPRNLIISSWARRLNWVINDPIKGQGFSVMNWSNKNRGES